MLLISLLSPISKILECLGPVAGLVAEGGIARFDHNGGIAGQMQLFFGESILVADGSSIAFIIVLIGEDLPTLVVYQDDERAQVGQLAGQDGGKVYVAGEGGEGHGLDLVALVG